MPTDFRSGTVFPRPGRMQIGGFAWIARISDKGRAAQAKTIHDYIYPCPMDMGVLERWGIPVAEFDQALKENATDEALVAWLNGRVDAAKRDKANDWVLKEKVSNLDRQDAEEGVLTH